MKRPSVRSVAVGLALISVIWAIPPRLVQGADPSPAPSPSPSVSATPQAEAAPPPPPADLLEAPITTEAETPPETLGEAEAEVADVPAEEMPAPPDEPLHPTAPPSVAAQEKTEPVPGTPTPAPEPVPVQPEAPTVTAEGNAEEAAPETPTEEEQVAQEQPQETEPAAPPAETQPPAAVAEAPAPEPEAPSTSVAASPSKRIPIYQRATPHWGVELIGSAKALGRKDISSLQAGVPARSLEFQIDYQPPFFQKLNLGVLGFGPSVGIYPMVTNLLDSSQPKAAKAYTSFWQIGGQIRYQARFFREQILVPQVSLQYQSLSYQFTDQAERKRTSLVGPSFGLWLLLNIFERSAASDFYLNQGVSRSYLVGEVRSLSGSDEVISVSGQSYYFGLRIEL